MLKSIRMYIRFFFLFLSGKVVRKNEYKEEYNEVSKTYTRWIERMGKYSNEIFQTELLDTRKEIRILDFACGTGYFSNSLLSKIDSPNLNITAVDISEEMLKVAREEITDTRCSFILQEGMSFLEKEENEKYDAIYCGFALPYFNLRKLFKQFNRVLKKNGSVHIITNCRGTLKGIYEIYFDLMKSDPSLVINIMEIRFKLPKSEKSLNALFAKYEFEKVKIDTINEWVIFDTPRKLFEWLKQTGAIAGTGKIFTNQKHSEERIIKKIEENLSYKNQYRINHKFILAIFQKSSIK